VSQRPAVVFGLLWAGLALARSLGRSGVPVTGVAYEPTDFGVRSRHLTRRVAATGDRDERLLAALREAARDGRPVLFPERDESVHVVLRNWDEIRELADLPLPDDAQIVEKLRRKDLLRAEADRAGVPLPATIMPDGEESIRTSGLRPPYLIKPVTGQEFAYMFGEKLFVADDVDAAVAAWRRASEHGFETVVQELIPGSQEKIYSLFTYIGRDGEALASVVGRKLRQGPLRFGTSAVFLVEFDERVLDLGLRLLRGAGYRGFAQVEFAHDARDDTFRVLEVNTRLPMWAGVAMSRWFDLARIAYDDLCGKPAPAPRTFREDVAWVYFAKDAWVGMQMLRRRDIGLRDFATPYLRRKKVRSTFAADDPLPALASMTYLRSKLGSGSDSRPNTIGVASANAAKTKK
jgi:predicted ATP-grasp superfamily ATP-dependent carboligase